MNKAIGISLFIRVVTICEIALLPLSAVACYGGWVIRNDYLTAEEHGISVQSTSVTSCNKKVSFTGLRRAGLVECLPCRLSIPLHCWHPAIRRLAREKDPFERP
jgi:hypothetical protein